MLKNIKIFYKINNQNKMRNKKKIKKFLNNKY